MTISSTTRRAGPYVGNGVATSFAFAFKVFDAADVEVTLTTISTGAESVLTLTSDYTVTLNPDQNASPGGSITYPASGSPMASTHNLTITSAVANLQETDVINTGEIALEVLEEALDRGVILTQQVAEVLGRSLTVPVADDAPAPLPPASERALNYLAFDSNGDPIASTGLASATVSAAMAPVVASATISAARQRMVDGYSTVAAHATAMNPWGSAGQVDITGSAVVITDIADAPHVGATVWMRMYAAHTWTYGATFAVQGNADYTCTPGDWVRVTALTVSTFSVTIFKADGSSVMPTAYGQALLKITDATHVVLVPNNGNLLTVNGVPCTVQDGGVTYTISGLAANTTYYVYAVATAGAVSSLELSATVPVASTTAKNKGVRIKTGDDTRSLVGMVRTTGATQFADSASQRFVRSWFNDAGVSGSKQHGANVTLSSSPYYELNTGARTEFLAWADELLTAQAQAYVYDTTATGGTIYVISGVDGAAVAFGQVATPTSVGGYIPVCAVVAGYPLTAGYHYVTVMGGIAGGSVPTAGTPASSFQTTRSNR